MRILVAVVFSLILRCTNAAGVDVGSGSAKRLVLHSAEDQAAEIVSLKQTVASLQTALASLQTDYKTLQNTTSSLQTNYNTLQTTTSSLQTDYNTLQTTTSSLQTDYNTLQTRTSTLQTDYNTLQTTTTTLQTLYQTLQNAHRSLDSQVQTLAVNTGINGSIFIRWGRKQCPGTADLIYKGYTSGKHYNDSGSGVDTFCLPEEPVWGKYSDAAESDRAYIYGTEIDNNDDDNVFPYPVNQQDMPCAVCRSERALNLMIPGRTACYSGWTLEYSGYMTTAIQGRNSGQDTICVDDHPEFLDHGGSDDNQHVLYLVETKCGSLPCPPYANNRELPCAVCSK